MIYLDLLPNELRKIIDDYVETLDVYSFIEHASKSLIDMDKYANVISNGKYFIYIISITDEDWYNICFDHRNNDIFKTKYLKLVENYVKIFQPYEKSSFDTCNDLHVILKHLSLKYKGYFIPPKLEKYLLSKGIELKFDYCDYNI